LKRASAPPDHDGYVLVVDDDPGSLGVTQTTLAQLGYRTMGASDGESGLRAATEEQPLAVILDLAMPGMNGFEFLELFRRMREHRNVPVLVWTLADLTAEEERCLRASAQGIVKKAPALRVDLTEEIRAFCDAQLAHPH
jgi:CheY-like chemotaxis protein